MELAHDLDRRVVVAVELGRRRVHVHDDLVPARIPQHRRPLDQVVADRDHDVGLGELFHVRELGPGPLEPHRRERVLSVRHERAFGHVGVRRPDPGALHEPAQGLDRGAAGGLPANDAVADEDHRLPRSVDHVRGALDHALVGPRVRRPTHLERRHVHGLRSDVLGQLDVRRARLLDARQAERLAHDLGHRVGDGDARRPFRDRLEHPHDVHVLVRLHVRALESRLAGDRDERRAVELRIGDAGEQVRRAGSERRETHARI